MEIETTVGDILPRTYNVKSFRFPRPASLNYKPGQCMFVTIKVGGAKMKKPFSISTSPTERDYIEFTKKLTGHPFSNALDALKVGDHVTVDAPHGDFTYEGEHERVGFLCGGIGITPVRSICKYCTDMDLDAKITLLYGNNTEADIVFKQDLEEMQQQNRNLKVVFTLTDASASWRGRIGKIEAQMIKKEIPDYLNTVFYICGPPPMVEAMETLLKGLNVQEENIKTEHFAGY